MIINPEQHTMSDFVSRRTNSIAHQSEVDAVSHVFLEADNNLRFVIGRYIHDHSQQWLQQAISLVQEHQARLIADGPLSLPQSLDVLQQVLVLLTQADKSLSATRHQLMPVDLQKGRFQMAMEAYILEDLPVLHPDAAFEIEYQLDLLGQLYDQIERADDEILLAQKMILALFLREGLENAYKHSAATQVSIASALVSKAELEPLLAALSLQIALTADNYLCLWVQNNGLSMPVNTRGTLPLRANGSPSSFHEFELRARSLRGFTLLNPTAGPGTTWQLYLPVP